MKRKYRNITIFVKAAFSIVFFFILLSFVKSNELITVFTGVNWLFFTLSFFLAIVMLMVSCLKWQLLLNASEQNLNYFFLLRTYLIGYFFSNLLPSTVGGDVVRSYYVGRLINNQASAAASIFLERFTGMLFLLVLVVLAPLMQPVLYKNPFIFIPSIGATVLLLIILCLWKMKNPLAFPDKILNLFFSYLCRFAGRRDSISIKKYALWLESAYESITDRLLNFKNELNTSLAVIRNDKRLFTHLFVLTFVFYFLTWVNVFVAFLAFGVQPSFIATSALVPTIMFVGQIPLTFLGNLGFIESVFIFYFLQLEIPASESLAMGLLLRIKMLWLGIIGYLIYLSVPNDQKAILPTRQLVEKIES